MLYIADRPFIILPEAAIQPYNDVSAYCYKPSLPPVETIVTYDADGNYGAVTVNPPEDFTAKQTRVFVLGALGLENTEQAEQYFNSENTIKTHRGMVFSKLGVHTMAGAVAAAFESGLLEVTDPLPYTGCLSPRETDVLVSGAELDSQTVNAAALGISINTLKTYRRNVCHKLRAKNLEGAIFVGHLYGILKAPTAYTLPVAVGAL